MGFLICRDLNLIQKKKKKKVKFYANNTNKCENEIATN